MNQQNAFSLRRPARLLGPVLLSLASASCDGAALWGGLSAQYEGNETPCSAQLPCARDEGAPPVCDLARGVCVSCDAPGAAGDGACGLGRHCASGPDYPAPGTCVACTRAAHCAVSEACWRGRCVPSCTAHEDCESAACDRSGPAQAVEAPAGRGACVPPGLVSYVSPDLAQAGRCGGTGQRLADPACSLAEVLARLPVLPAEVGPYLGARLRRLRVVRLVPAQAALGAYEAPAAEEENPAAPTHLLLLGSDVPRSRMRGTPDQAALTVRRGQRVVLQGVDLADGERGLLCDGLFDKRPPAVALYDLLVTNHAREGLFVENCDLTLSRVTIRDARRGAFKFWGHTRYRITNSVVVRNTAVDDAVLFFANDAKGIFRFNTVADNASTYAPALSCGPIRRALADSIIVRNRPVDLLNRPQTDEGCDLTGSAGEESQPEFVDGGALDYRLVPGNARNQACCIDQIAPGDLLRSAEDGDLQVDALGAPRPQGQGADRGAYEAK